MRILITGGAGFIGSHVVEHYQALADEIIVVDNLRSGRVENLTGLRHTLIEASVTDYADIRHLFSGVDYVFHLAAMVSVVESMNDVNKCININNTGLLNVLRASEEASVKKLVFASSAAIYGNNEEVPKLETMLPEPLSPYAITKLDGEYYLEMYQRKGILETASIRFFNVFGPRQDLNGSYAASIPIFIERSLNDENITIYGDGGQTRDFIYVKDIVGALAFAASTKTVRGVYNAGYSTRNSINDIVSKIIKETESTSSIEYAAERTGDVRHSLACSKKLTDAGWRPLYTLNEGLTETVNSLRS